MKALAQATTLSMLLMLAGVASAQAVDSKVDSKKSSNRYLTRIVTTLEYLRNEIRKGNTSLLVTRTPQPCSNGSCPSDVTVTEIQDDSGKPVSCIVTANNIDLSDPGPGNGHKSIFTWTFKEFTVAPGSAKPSPQASYAFPAFNGLAITEDNKKQTSGRADPDTPAEAKLTHKHSQKKGDSVTYYPLVIQSIQIDPPPAPPVTLGLCYAGDPKIINSN